MKNIVAIIPARMASSRFPGKPMAMINDVPMIDHCYERTNMCKTLMAAYVATCDKNIQEYVLSIGGNCIMTDDTHERASDRVAEAMLKIESSQKMKIDIVVMVQGDEPMITPQMINKSIEPFSRSEDIQIVNLMSKINSVGEFVDPNEVKVVVNEKSDAIYFSREPIPSRKKGYESVPMFKQVCIIPFTRKALLNFNDTPETELEKIESVDMLRVIENGNSIHIVEVKEDTYSVDTEDDRKKVEKLLLHDELTELYRP